MSENECDCGFRKVYRGRELICYKCEYDKLYKSANRLAEVLEPLIECAARYGHTDQHTQWEKDGEAALSEFKNLSPVGGDNHGT